MNIGKTIRNIRKEQIGLNQKELSTELGITQSYLSQIENGNRVPSMDLIVEISKFFEVPTSILFWFSTDVKDVREEKREAFLMLKPSVDKLINSII